MNPFFRWAGGKRRLTKPILELLGPVSGRYIEPFCGSAAIFFALEHEGTALLNDASSEITRVLRGVKRYPEEVKQRLFQLAIRQNEEGHKEVYAELKRRIMVTTDQAEFAASFIALNQTSFNGLWRVNQRKGEYNVPMGYRISKGEKLPYDIDALDLQPYSKLLANAELTCGSFETIEAEKGDSVYCDPPYFGKFTGYNEQPFSGFEAHQRLYDWCRRSAAKGVRVILSGADNIGTKQIYGDPTVTLTRACTIGAGNRGRVGELLYVWEGK